MGCDRCGGEMMSEWFEGQSEGQAYVKGAGAV